MICNFQIGLDELASKFLKVKKVKGEDKLKTPHPCIEMPYTHLMASFILRYPALMSMVKYECSTWRDYYMSAISKTLRHHKNY